MLQRLFGRRPICCFIVVLVGSVEPVTGSTSMSTDPDSAKIRNCVLGLTVICRQFEMMERSPVSQILKKELLTAAVTFIERGTLALRSIDKSSVLNGSFRTAQGSPGVAIPDKQTRDALLRTLTDSRKTVRSEAAKDLASSSDEVALSVIEAGIESRLFSELEAVNYFGLADIKISGPYLLRRLATGSLTQRPWPCNIWAQAQFIACSFATKCF
jgi:hypothetical protein